MQRSNAASRHFYSAFYRWSILNSKPSAGHDFARCVRRNQSSGAAAVVSNPTIRRLNSRGREQNRDASKSRGKQSKQSNSLSPSTKTVRADSGVDALRTAALQSSRDRPFDTLEAWQYAIRHRSDVGAMIEVAVPSAQLATIQEAQGQQLEEIGEITGARLEVRPGIGQDGQSSAQLLSVLISGTFGAVHAAKSRVEAFDSQPWGVVELQRRTRGLAQRVEHSYSVPLSTSAELSASQIPPWHFAIRERSGPRLAIELSLPWDVWAAFSESQKLEDITSATGVRATLGPSLVYDGPGPESGSMTRCVSLAGTLQQIVRARVSFQSYNKPLLSAKDASREGEPQIGLATHALPIVEDIRLPSQFTKHILGSGGKQLKYTIARSGSSIKIRNRATKDREYVRLKGSRDAVENAKDMIQKVLDRACTEENLEMVKVSDMIINVDAQGPKITKSVERVESYDHNASQDGSNSAAAELHFTIAEMPASTAHIVFLCNTRTEHKLHSVASRMLVSVTVVESSSVDRVRFMIAGYKAKPVSSVNVWMRSRVDQFIERQGEPLSALETIKEGVVHADGSTNSLDINPSSAARLNTDGHPESHESRIHDAQLEHGHPDHGKTLAPGFDAGRYRSGRYFTFFAVMGVPEGSGHLIVGDRRDALKQYKKLGLICYLNTVVDGNRLFLARAEDSARLEEMLQLTHTLRERAGVAHSHPRCQVLEQGEGAPTIVDVPAVMRRKRESRLNPLLAPAADTDTPATAVRQSGGDSAAQETKTGSDPEVEVFQACDVVGDAMSRSSPAANSGSADLAIGDAPRSAIPGSPEELRRSGHESIAATSTLEGQEPEVKPEAADLAAGDDSLAMADTLKATLRHFTYPVVVITTFARDSGGERLNRRSSLAEARAVTVSSFNTVTLTPRPIISFNLKTPSRTWDAIKESQRVMVHVLAASAKGAAIAHAFAQRYERAHEPFSRLMELENVRVLLKRNRSPKIFAPGAVLARLRVNVSQEQCLTVGDHVVVMGEVAGVVEDEEDLGGVTNGALAYGMREYRGLSESIEPLKLEQRQDPTPASKAFPSQDAADNDEKSVQQGGVEGQAGEPGETAETVAPLDHTPGQAVVPEQSVDDAYLDGVERSDADVSEDQSAAVPASSGRGSNDHYFEQITEEFNEPEEARATLTSQPSDSPLMKAQTGEAARSSVNMPDPVSPDSVSSRPTAPPSELRAEQPPQVNKPSDTAIDPSPSPVEFARDVQKASSSPSTSWSPASETPPQKEAAKHAAKHAWGIAPLNRANSTKAH